MTKGCESKGRISGLGDGGLPLLRCSESLQRNSGRRPGYKRESPDYQWKCFVYTAEKALLNTQETKEIWWWRQCWCETGIHQGKDNYRNVTAQLNGSVSAFVAGIRSVCRKNQELWHHIELKSVDWAIYPVSKPKRPGSFRSGATSHNQNNTAQL